MATHAEHHSFGRDALAEGALDPADVKKHGVNDSTYSHDERAKPDQHGVEDTKNDQNGREGGQKEAPQVEYHGYGRDVLSEGSLDPERREM